MGPWFINKLRQNTVISARSCNWVPGCAFTLEIHPGSGTPRLPRESPQLASRTLIAGSASSYRARRPAGRALCLDPPPPSLVSCSPPPHAQVTTSTTPTRFPTMKVPPAPPTRHHPQHCLSLPSGATPCGAPTPLLLPPPPPCRPAPPFPPRARITSASPPLPLLPGIPPWYLLVVAQPLATLLLWPPRAPTSPPTPS